jgi:hypothetical protein
MSPSLRPWMDELEQSALEDLVKKLCAAEVDAVLEKTDKMINTRFEVAEKKLLTYCKT